MRRVPLSLQISVGMGVGLVVGPLLGARAEPLGELGKLVIQLIKAAATPLLFFAIVNAILQAEVRGRQGLVMLGFALLSSSIALALGLAISNLFHPVGCSPWAGSPGAPRPRARSPTRKSTSSRRCRDT